MKKYHSKPAQQATYIRVYEGERRLQGAEVISVIHGLQAEVEQQTQRAEKAEGDLAKANEQIQKLSTRNAELVEPLEKCPITRRDLFMVIDGKATYGGPFDSYTIPVMQGKPDEKWHERELAVERFDHDEGGWSDSEIIPVRVISEEYLYELDEQLAKANERVEKLEVEKEGYALRISKQKEVIKRYAVEAIEIAKAQEKFAIEQQRKGIEDYKKSDEFCRLLDSHFNSGKVYGHNEYYEQLRKEQENG